MTYCLPNKNVNKHSSSSFQRVEPNDDLSLQISLCAKSHRHSTLTICDYIQNDHLTHEEAWTLITRISLHQCWNKSPYGTKLMKQLDN